MADIAASVLAWLKSKGKQSGRQEFLGRPFTAAINEDFFGEHWIASKNMWE